jgi:hypothetical protein
MICARFASESARGAGILNGGMQKGKRILVASCFLLDADPKDLRFAVWGEGAAAANLQFKRFRVPACCFAGRREIGNPRHRNITEKFEREVKVVFATPTSAYVRESRAEFVDLIFDQAANGRRKFDRDEGAIGSHRCPAMNAEGVAKLKSRANALDGTEDIKKR